MLVKIDDIKIKKRVRRNLGDMDALKESLRMYGLLNPITLNENNELIAGERRLQAAKTLGAKSLQRKNCLKVIAVLKNCAIPAYLCALSTQ